MAGFRQHPGPQGEPQSGVCGLPGSPLQLSVASSQAQALDNSPAILVTVPAMHGRHAPHLCAGLQVASSLRVSHSQKLDLMLLLMLWCLGLQVAILAGDFLLARASMSLAALHNTEVIVLLSQVIEHLVSGEILQVRAQHVFVWADCCSVQVDH